MTPIKKYEPLLNQMMQFALNNGCSACKLMLGTYEGTKIDIANGDVDTMKLSCSNGLLMRIYLPDGRSNSFSTNRLDSQELEQLVLQSIETARFLAPDVARMLPDLDRCYREGDSEKLDQMDAAFFDHTMEEKMALVRYVDGQIADKECLMHRCVYNDSVSQDLYVTSHGLSLSSCVSQYSLTAMVTLKGLGDDRPDGYEYCTRITFDELKKGSATLAQKAWQKANAQVAPRVATQGTMKVVVDTHSIFTLIEPLLDAASGSALRQRNSFLYRMRGHRVGSKLLNLLDLPHKKHTLGARLYDSEGLATRRRYFFHDGVLRTYFLTTFHANKLRMKPTCDEPSVLVMPNGKHSLEQLLQTIQGDGLYITDFIGGNCNPVTGDFSFGITGFTVKDGKIVSPLIGQNLTGNMLEFWNHLALVGNDADVNSSVQIPSLLFENITIA
ncbi:MAG: TldD/PmbA family protein [Paludibacteraceae bacterium]|nr:TldD/PmbA family protein [Paludibacteraceae bacterium]